MKPPSLKALQTRCENWNKVFPVGAQVNYHSVIGDPKHISTKTRSEAFILSGHTAVVFVENVSGCVALDALTSASTDARPSEGPKDPELPELDDQPKCPACGNENHGLGKCCYWCGEPLKKEDA